MGCLAKLHPASRDVNLVGKFSRRIHPCLFLRPVQLIDSSKTLDAQSMDGNLKCTKQLGCLGLADLEWMAGARPLTDLKRYSVAITSKVCFLCLAKVFQKPLVAIACVPGRKRC